MTEKAQLRFTRRGWFYRLQLGDMGAWCGPVEDGPTALQQARRLFWEHPVTRS